VAGGYTNAQIANLLGYSLRTIESSRARPRAAPGVRAPVSPGPFRARCGSRFTLLTCQVHISEIN